MSARPIRRLKSRSAPITLLVDARGLHASGIGRYLRELLARWLADERFARLVLLGDVAQLREFCDGRRAPNDVVVAAHPGAFYSLESQRSWQALRRRGLTVADVAFFPHWDAPLLGAPARSVVTVHDLIHFRVPDAFPLTRRLLAARVLDRVVRTATSIVTVSETTARDLAARFPGASTRVRTVPNGVSAPFDGAAPTLVPVSGPYLLCVGNRKPHKNLRTALDVLARVRATHPTMHLVVAGPSDGDDALLAMAAAAGVPNAVVPMGEVSDAVLHALYAHCAALVFPSRYEGFGLPVVEAMASGAPVVGSSTPAVAEVARGAALLFDPDDAVGMGGAVVRLLNDPVLRAERVAAGRRVAAGYRWGVTADRTAEVLCEIADPGTVRRPISTARTTDVRQHAPTPR